MKEYSDILQCHIRKMLKANDASRFYLDVPPLGTCRLAFCSRSYQISGHPRVFLPFPVMDPLALVSKVHVAERKPSKGAFVQEDAAYTMVIPLLASTTMKED